MKKIAEELLIIAREMVAGKRIVKTLEEPLENAINQAYFDYNEDNDEWDEDTTPNPYEDEDAVSFTKKHPRDAEDMLEMRLALSSPRDQMWILEGALTQRRKVAEYIKKNHPDLVGLPQSKLYRELRKRVEDMREADRIKDILAYGIY